MGDYDEDLLLRIMADVTDQIKTAPKGDVSADVKNQIQQLLKLVDPNGYAPASAGMPMLELERPATPKVQVTTSGPGSMSGSSPSRQQSMGNLTQGSPGSSVSGSFVGATIRAGAERVVQADCCVCFREVPGQFFKTGFKCQTCIGRPANADLSLHYSVVGVQHGGGGGDGEGDEGAAGEGFIFNDAESNTTKVCLPPSTRSKNARYDVFSAPLDIDGELFASKMAVVCHPNVAYPYAVIPDDKRCILRVVYQQYPGVLECPVQGGVDRLRKLVVGALQGLQYLHSRQVLHGRLDERAIQLDLSDNVRITGAFPCNTDTRRQCFLPPENMDANGEYFTNTPHADTYSLGVLFSLMAFGTETPPAASELDPSSGLTDLLDLIEKMTAPVPMQRIKLEKALEHAFIETIRCINGVPQETQIAHIGNEETAGDADNAALTASHGKRIDVLVRDHSAARGPAELQSFLKENGGSYQVLRGSYSVTLYSIKNDPRRKKKAKK